MRLAVYVPRNRVLAEAILPRSAIVGSPWNQGHPQVLIDYEGNRYGAVNLGTFEERLLHAAGRHTSSYPTVARRVVDAEELLQVGWYDDVDQALEVTDQAALDEWLGRAS